MPEGDTIHRTARALRTALVGKVIRRFASTRILSRDLPGKQITAVDAIGKHLLIRLSDRRAIQLHMGMTGSMHVYRLDERWRKPEGMARLVIDVDDARVVAFAVPTLRLVVDDRPVGHLGPDVLSPDFDAEEAVRRLRARADMPLGVAIMDQSAVSGVGNIYKSETLYAVGVDPFLAVREFDDETLHKIVDRARRLMTSNLRGRMRTTTRNHAQRHYVYRRRDLPCVRCGAAIEMRRQGEQSRSTYYCPRCQLGRVAAR